MTIILIGDLVHIGCKDELIEGYINLQWKEGLLFLIMCNGIHLWMSSYDGIWNHNVANVDDTIVE